MRPSSVSTPVTSSPRRSSSRTAQPVRISAPAARASSASAAQAAPGSMRRASAFSSAYSTCGASSGSAARSSAGPRPLAALVAQDQAAVRLAVEREGLPAALVQVEEELERAPPDRIHRGLVRADHEAVVAARGGLREPGRPRTASRPSRAVRRRPRRRCRRCRRPPRRRRASGSLQAGERRVAEPLGRQRGGVRAVGGRVDGLPRDLQRTARARRQRLRPGQRRGSAPGRRARPRG